MESLLISAHSPLKCILHFKPLLLRYKIKILSNFLLLILICTSGYYLYNLIINKSPILSITTKNNNLIIELDNNYDCLFTDEYILPDVDSNKWVASDKEYKCYTKFDNSKYIFLKKNNKIVYSSDDVHRYSSTYSSSSSSSYSSDI